MGFAESSSSIWEEIEQSESFLVCSMYEEAASLASSVIKRITQQQQQLRERNHNKPVAVAEEMDGSEFHDMMESAGMVLVQSLNQLGRTSESLNELKSLFVSAAAVPVQVLLTGTCFQITKGSLFGVREFLEEFLSSWHYVDGRYYLLGGVDANPDIQDGCCGNCILEVDQYMEVVEAYVVTFLGAILNNLDLAISWVEKATIPEERKQVLLRRLHSLHSLKTSNILKSSSLPENNSHGSKTSSVDLHEGSPIINHVPNGDSNTKQAIMKLSRQVDPCFWWFRSINLKLGSTRLVITNGKIVLGCLIILIYYLIRKKGASLSGIVRRQILSLKKAVSDLWQLAFSYQVNPLAAVQPLPAAPRGTR
ncbi:hypothetical protein Tsubulata_027986 [Turnera subulata]|uniref:Protein APEM9 n=1 Tax=Turnera subulata TaxID=218843 RepID=A0A9Q0FHX4_9ROSI|nr:hypothetical protein Tsubulata_027986 [Turnera subulata]